MPQEQSQLGADIRKSILGVTANSADFNQNINVLFTVWTDPCVSAPATPCLGFSTMSDEAAVPRSAAPAGDARDMLAHLYREIGILAVAAALQVMAPKSDEPTEAESSPAPLRKSDVAA
jgi:hypothetical protein